ncbi:MAG: hypothetical protein NZ534_12545, partial [Bacteroidia bacterium]|nr:hypothetical protein [Bacteroidia bacterium]
MRYAFRDKVGGWYRVQRVHGRLLFSTPKGIYHRRGTRLEPHPAFNFRAQVHYIAEYGSDMLIIHYEGDSGGLYTQKFDRNGKQAPIMLSALDGWSFSHILVENEGVLWLGGAKGLVRYEPTDSLGAEPFPPMLRKLTAKRDSVLFWGTFVNDYGGLISAPSSGFKFNIPYSLNSIRFEFGVPIYRQSVPLYFQFFLEKFDESPPTEWSSAPFKEYTNLSEGRYTLWVTVKDERGTPGPKIPVVVEVAAPWNRTFGFYTLAVVGALALLLLLYKFISVPVLRRNKLLDENNRYLNVDLSAKSVEIRRLDEALTQKNREIALLNEALSRSEERENSYRLRLEELENVLVEWVRFAGAIRELT